MNYHIFTQLVDGFAELRFEEESDEVTSLFEGGKRIRHSSINAVEWGEADSKPPHDCPVMTYGVFAFSEQAWAVLGPLLANDAQAVRLAKISKVYYAINVLSVLPALDVQESRITRFSNGKVDGILKYAFEANVIRGHHMFRIPERRCDTFVSGHLLDTAIGAGLKGFVKSNSVFKSYNP